MWVRAATAGLTGALVFFNSQEAQAANRETFDAELSERNLKNDQFRFRDSFALEGEESLEYLMTISVNEKGEVAKSAVQWLWKIPGQASFGSGNLHTVLSRILRQQNPELSEEELEQEVALQAFDLLQEGYQIKSEVEGVEMENRYFLASYQLAYEYANQR